MSGDRRGGVPLDAYAPGSIDQLSAQYLTDPQGTFRFDASDLMPAAVGAETEAEGEAAAE